MRNCGQPNDSILDVAFHLETSWQAKASKLVLLSEEGAPGALEVRRAGPPVCSWISGGGSFGR
jgi:hypothetical protein